MTNLQIPVLRSFELQQFLQNVRLQISQLRPEMNVSRPPHSVHAFGDSSSSVSRMNDTIVGCKGDEEKYEPSIGVDT